METENKHNIKCDKCTSSRILDVYVQGRDTHNFSYDGLEYEGYSKEGVGLYGNYGDALDFQVCMQYFQVCMQCGKVQGSFPKEDKEVKKIFEKDDE